MCYLSLPMPASSAKNLIRTDRRAVERNEEPNGSKTCAVSAHATSTSGCSSHACSDTSHWRHDAKTDRGVSRHELGTAWVRKSPGQAWVMAMRRLPEVPTKSNM